MPRGAMPESHPAFTLVPEIAGRASNEATVAIRDRPPGTPGSLPGRVSPPPRSGRCPVPNAEGSRVTGGPEQ